MKRKKKFGLILITTLMFFVGVYIFANFYWLTLYSFDDMKYNARIVDSSFTLPENFVTVWDKLYPKSRNNGMTKQLLSELGRELGVSKIYDCKCDEIGYFAWDNDNHNFKFNIEKGVGKYRTFGFGLQYYTRPSKCFDFWLNNSIFWEDHYLKDLNELSRIIFNRNVADLNQTEIIELIAYRNLGYRRSRDTIVFRETVSMLTEKLKEK